MNSCDSTRFRIALHRTRSGYFARAVDIPGCVSRGSTEVEAVENARAIIRSYLRLARLFETQRPIVELEISA
jgi:predicted RNase H-like HicB family nuclease